MTHWLSCGECITIVFDIKFSNVYKVKKEPEKAPGPMVVRGVVYFFVNLVIATLIKLWIIFQGIYIANFYKCRELLISLK